MNFTYKLQVIRQLGDEQVSAHMDVSQVCYVIKEGSKPIQAHNQFLFKELALGFHRWH